MVVTTRDDDPGTAAITRRRFAGVLVAGVAGAAGVSGVGGRVLGGGRSLFDAGQTTSTGRLPVRLDEPERRRWDRVTVGWSVEGRSIDLWKNVTRGARSSVLVVAALHGDERGTAPAAHELLTVPIPDGIDAYVLPVANPDGWERGTRRNAADVDLNRNFPYLWQHIGFGGPSPASEPETQTMMRVVEQIRPTVTIWIHEPYEYVAYLDDSSRAYAAAWGIGSGLRTRWVQQYGGGETWTAHGAGLPSVLVEGISRDGSVDDLQRHRAGFEVLLTLL